MSLPAAPEVAPAAAAVGKRTYGPRRPQRVGGLRAGECAVCTATLPAEGSKEVNIRKILNVEGVEEQFFTCGRACASTMYGANLQSPKARRVIDNLWAALAPTLGTRLRAGDAAEIMTDELPSLRARVLELEDELARRADTAAAAAAADAADASKWRSLRLPRRVPRSSVGGVEYDDETQLTANL